MNANANQTTAYTGVEESLSSYFQRSAAVVRQYADLIEQEYAQPILRYASLKFRERPFTMTFLSIFAGLSALPLLSFAGLTVFILSSIVFLALISAVTIFITIEAVLVTGLLFTLWSLFTVASFTTAVVVLVYWTMRLGMFVSHEGPSGVTDWAYETRQYMFYGKRQEQSEVSEDSPVLVDNDGPSSKKIKVEEEPSLNN